MNRENKIRKLAWMGLLSSLAIIFGYVEMLLPVFTGIPGIKLGLANLVTVFVLYTYTYKEAAAVSAIRIIVIGFLFGNLFSILFSLAGAGFSLLCMTLALSCAGSSRPVKCGWSAYSPPLPTIWGRYWWLFWWWKISISFIIFQRYWLRD